MPRNRIIFQSESLYVGPSPATGAHFDSGTSGNNLITNLVRVQSVNYSLNIPRTPVQEFGILNYIDRVIVDAPTVNVDANWLAAGLSNERAIGLTISSGTFVSAISGILNEASNDKNLFIKTTVEGKDAVGDTTQASVAALGIGNA